MDNGGKNRFREALNFYLAPGLLILIASVQMVRGHFYDQSPWKGGGFGMFSTVDSPGARFLKIYLISETGEIAVKAPNRLRRLDRIVRTVPTPKNLDLMAQELTRESWVRAPYPFLFYSQEKNAWQVENMTLSMADIQGREVRIRAKHSEEPEFALGHRVDYESLRVELWKFDYEKQDSTVRAKKHLETVLRRSER